MKTFGRQGTYFIKPIKLLYSHIKFQASNTILAVFKLRFTMATDTDE